MTEPRCPRCGEERLIETLPPRYAYAVCATSWPVPQADTPLPQKRIDRDVNGVLVTDES